MRFLENYELQEPLASGPIELFVAEEVSTGLRRLVHIIECKGVSGELTTQRILQLMRRVAPELPGVVLEAGRYKQTAHAYLITTYPADPSEVQQWVQSYKDLRDVLPATNGSALAPPPTSPPGLSPDEQPTAFVPARPKGTGVTTKEPGDFTAIFGGGGKTTPEEPTAIIPGPPKTSAAKSREPSDFTAVFGGSAKSSAQEEPTAIIPGPPKTSAAKNKEPGGFTAVFGGSSKTSAQEEPTAIIPGPPKTSAGKSKEQGDFTAIFSGAEKSAAQEPPTAIVPGPAKGAAPKRQQPDDFSAIFGGSSKSTAPQEPTAIVPGPPKGAADKGKEPGDFTRIFGRAGSAPPSEAPISSEPARGSAASEGVTAGPWSRQESAGLNKDFFDGRSAGTEKKPQTPADIFGQAAAPANASGPVGGDAKPGEFTSFFRGSAPAPAPVAEPLGSPSSPVNWDRTPAQPGTTPASADTAGEFTKILRGDYRRESSAGASGEQARPGFGDRSPFASSPPATQGFDLKARPAEGRPSYSSGIPEPNWNAAPKSEATQVYKPPEPEATPAEPVSTGPSDFTCIVSPPKPAPAPEEETADEPAASAAAPAPVPVQMPKLQPPPMPAKPAMPRAPAMPARPAAPKLPAVPPAPSAPQAASRLMSYLPLIIVVNVVVLVAIALVLYFALKSH